MRKIFLLLLLPLSLSGYSQSRYRSIIPVIGYVDSIAVDTINVARQSENFTVTESANLSGSFLTQIIQDGSVIESEGGKSNVFNIADSGLYDLRVSVARSNAIDRYISMYLKIKPAAFEEGDADLVLDLDAIQAGTFTNPLGDASISGNGTTNFLYNFGSVSRPGFKIYVKGDYSGRIQIVGLRGTQAQPARIQSPTSGQAVFEENYASQTMAIHFNGNNQYIHIDGQASSTHKYGIKIQGNGTDEARGILWQGDQQRGFIVAGVEFDGQRNPANTTAGGAAFQWSPPTPDVGENALNWDSEYLIFHDNYVHDAWGEGVYENFNDDAAVGGLFYNRTELFLAFDNVIERMLRDGIQISSCDSAVIVRNTIHDIGHEASTSHRSGIQINPGNFNVYVNSNYVTDVDVFLAAQSGDTGTGSLYTYSNFAKQRDTILTATPNQFVYHNVNDLDFNYHFFNNTIICPDVAIAPVTIERSSGGESYDFTFAGNVISTGGTDQATYDELRIVGTHDQTDWYVSNTWERTADEADLFLDSEYKPVSISSPAFNSGFDWSSRFPGIFLTLQRNRDLEGYTLKSGVSKTGTLTSGAYSGSVNIWK